MCTLGGIEILTSDVLDGPDDRCLLYVEKLEHERRREPEPRDFNVTTLIDKFNLRSGTRDWHT
jgi:hypothetical protein